MPSAAWRLLSLPFLLLALLLAATPDFGALDRAVATLFHASRPSEALPAATDAAPPQPAPQRRGVLVPLYVSFAVLQGFDVHSTLRALDGGAVEANPLMRGVAGNPAALIAVKAGVSLSTIYLVEKVRVKSRRAAIALMVALNSAYATIVAHNYSAAR